MIHIGTVVKVPAGSTSGIYFFMLNCTDQEYQAWWPGTHLAWHTIIERPGKLGNLVYFDEYVGRRRFKFQAIVTEIVPGQKIVWQLKKIVRLPAWLRLEFTDHLEGTEIKHTLEVGFQVIGRVINPWLRLYFNADFAKELDEHARTEFPMLVSMLASQGKPENQGAGVE